jgi:N-acyl-L-homoserine lactone synthetase
VVAPDHNNGVASLGLIRAMIELAGSAAIDNLYFEIEPWFLRSLRATGIPVEEITEPVWVYNTWNVVCHSHVPTIWDAAEASLSSGRPTPMASYFATPWSWSIEAGDVEATRQPA